MTMIENEEKITRALLVSVDTGDFDAEASLSELEELVKSAGAEPEFTLTQKLQRSESATFVGSGKLQEIKELCEAQELDLIVVDSELSPTQIKNIENFTDVRVIDRTTLILDIFAQRARSKEGKLQVELAQLKYLLPRLTGKGIEMSRLGGGIGTRGPGETKIETDRRHIRRRMETLKEELAEVEKHRHMLRRRREKDGVITCAIVGYTNAGKSTLLQILGSLSSPDSGSLVIDGVDVAGLNGKALAEFRNRKVGFVFQFHHLLPEFTAIENVMLPALIAGRSRKECQLEAERLLADMGLADRLSHKPSELSGGEQQRVAIARALINNPAVLFADEPSGNLDSKTKGELHNLFFELRDKYGQTIIIVTHDPDLAKMCDRELYMVDGQFV